MPLNLPLPGVSPKASPKAFVRAQFGFDANGRDAVAKPGSTASLTETATAEAPSHGAAFDAMMKRIQAQKEARATAATKSSQNTSHQSTSQTSETSQKPDASRTIEAKAHVRPASAAEKTVVDTPDQPASLAETTQTTESDTPVTPSASADDATTIAATSDQTVTPDSQDDSQTDTQTSDQASEQAALAAAQILVQSTVTAQASSETITDTAPGDTLADAAPARPRLPLGRMAPENADPAGDANGDVSGDVSGEASAAPQDGNFATLLGKAAGEAPGHRALKGVKGTAAMASAAVSNDASKADALKTDTTADAKPALAQARSVLDAFKSDAIPQTAEKAADKTASDATADAALPPATPVQSDATTTPTAFSLQATADTPGSYSATGASTAAASNLSKAAVESMSALSMQISKRLSDASTRFAIELHPADLGKVEVALNIGHDGKTTAHLRFDNPVTASTFSAHESDLRQQLASVGLTLDKESLSFSSRADDDANAFSGSFAGSFSGTQQQAQDQSSQARHAARALKAAGQAADEADINTALDTALTRFRNRGSQTLALNLIV